MSTLVIALVCFAVAFVGGGILSKAYFTAHGSSQAGGRNKTHALLQAQRNRYRKRVDALNNVIRLHEETRGQIREKLAGIESRDEERGQSLVEAREQIEQFEQRVRDLEQSIAEKDRRIAELDAGESDSAAIEKKLGVLRIERDELVARIRRMETDQSAAAATPPDDTEDEIARMRADMGELRETLATRNRRIHDLELRLVDSTEQARRLQAKLDSWKQRVSPLTRKLKQQKEVIRKFCHEPDVEPAARENQSADNSADEPADDLKAIRGIGPALERRLHRHGIRRYRQLAEMSPEELADIARKLAIAPTLAERDAWIAQARGLDQRADLCQIA